MATKHATKPQKHVWTDLQNTEYVHNLLLLI